MSQGGLRSKSVRDALARIQGRAAAAALLSPLTLATASASAVTQSFGVSITSSNSISNGVDTFTYTVSNTTTGQSTPPTYTFPYVDKFEIPEFHAGDLTVLSLPNQSWTATEEITASQSGTAIKGGTAGAYILLSTPTNSGVGIEGSETFVFTSLLPNTANASFGYTQDMSNFNTLTEGSSETSQTGFVDPIIPAGGSTPVPEPASLLMLGTAVLAAGAARGRRTR